MGIMLSQRVILRGLLTTCQPEIQHFDKVKNPSSGANDDVAGFDIAVDDPGAVGFG